MDKNASKKMAVVQIKNMQYLVKEGAEVEIDRYAAKPGDKVKFEEVLLTMDGKDIKVGAPVVDKASIDAEVIAHTQGEKVRTFTYKAKARERKTKGARAKLTLVKITKIN